MKIENKTMSKKEAQLKLKKRFWVLSVSTSMRLLFWFVVNTLALETLFSVFISDDLTILSFAFVFAFCSSVLNYMLYYVFLDNLDNFSGFYKIFKILSLGFDYLWFVLGWLISVTYVFGNPLSMFCTFVLGLIPYCSHIEAIKMVGDRFEYETLKYETESKFDE